MRRCSLKKRQKIRRGILLGMFFVFPAIYYYFSPYLIIQATTERIINGSMIVFLFLFIASFALGRAYCGWICPAAGCQEALIPVRDKRIKRGNWVKWAIWIPWMTAIVLAAIKNKGYQEIHFFYQTFWGFSVQDIYSFITYLMVLLLIAVPAYLIGRRSFCHHVCWMAPFLILGRKIRNAFQWAALRLDSDSKKCVHCHTCTEHCPMSLKVEKMVAASRMEHSECILCGTCVDGCEEDAIRFVFRKQEFHQ